MTDEYQPVYVWSKFQRLFHWLNAIAVLLLLAIGLVIFNAGALDISSEGKILLKQCHVIVGYVFAINLLFRLCLGFVGKGYEKWGKTLPFMKGFGDEINEFKQNPHQQYKGHNPLGKLMIAALLLAMSIQTVTGLVIAGTDIYYPPLGQHFAESIAVDKNQLELIQPYSKENVDPEAYQAMRDFRKPFITIHVYTFYGLLFLIPLHLIGVIIGERREKTGLISSMITGYKFIKK
ncbi:cytochrome b/b6 domain-containing protein [Thalassotalea ganghwensis]